MRANIIRRFMLGAAAVAALGLALPTPPAQAQAKDATDYPTRPIRVVVPFAAGGGNDIFARLVGQRAQEILGQPLVIENRPGAGGRPAAEWVTNQEHDGYTLFVGASGVMSIAAAAYPKLAYHPTKSFVPLSMIADFPLIVVVAPNSPAKNVKELVDLAKKHPEKANYASTSPAFIIASELLKLESGMPGTMIPYKSSSQMVLSVAAGETMLAISDGPPAIPQIQAGKVRAIAVTGDERSAQLPDVPSMKEAGFPGVNTRLWSGFFAPAKTPPAVVAKLADAFSRAIKDPKVNKRLQEMAVNPGGGSSDEFRAMIDKDIQGYEKVISAAKLQKYFQN